MKRGKRIVSLLLALVMSVGMFTGLATTAFAATEEMTVYNKGGTGKKCFYFACIRWLYQVFSSACVRPCLVACAHENRPGVRQNGGRYGKADKWAAMVLLPGVWKETAPDSPERCLFRSFHTVSEMQMGGAYGDKPKERGLTLWQV